MREREREGERGKEEWRGRDREKYIEREIGMGKVGQRAEGRAREGEVRRER